MTKIIAFQSEDGRTVYVEVAPNEIDGETVVGAEDVVPAAARRLDEALAVIEPVVESIAKRLRALSPDKIGVEFGVKLNGEVGAIIAKSSFEGNFKVTMSWEVLERQGKTEGGPQDAHRKSN